MPILYSKESSFSKLEKHFYTENLYPMPYTDLM